jgi:tRNA-guanine family transglycosylase
MPSAALPSANRSRAQPYAEETVLLPAGRLRYLAGVGRPEDIVEAVRRGIACSMRDADAQRA